MISLLLGLVLAILAFGFVCYPLFRPREQRTVGVMVEDDSLEELFSRRDALYSAIKDLDFDYQTGSLSYQDYQDLVERYKRRAVSILQEIDAAKRGGSLEEDLEREIRGVRNVLEGAPLTPAVAGIEPAARFCTQCGARARTEDRFCAQCGTRLREET